MPFELIHKPTFINQLLALPPREMSQALEKVKTLCDDPSPYHNVRKKLHGYRGNIYRLRSGNLRIIYTYGDGWVALLGVDRRADVYKGERLVAEAGDVTIDLAQIPDTADALERDLPPLRSVPPAGAFLAAAAPASAPLPVAIDSNLLTQLLIPKAYFATLLACKTEDDLINADVPHEVCSRLIDAIFPRNYEQVAEQQPDLITGEVENLLRYREGTLLGFLLRLSPGQQKYVTWGLNATGPTLLKGAPGSGKSTVALYRAREFVRVLRRAGVTFPRILFTTYTNALVTYSQQLLKELLGADAICVEVQTADRLAMSIVTKMDGPVKIADANEVRAVLAEAIQLATFPGGAQQREAQRQAITKLGADYLLEEINTVIEARQIASYDAYRNAPRPGRRIPLNALQRQAVWQVCDEMRLALAQRGVVTWQRMRARAEEIVRADQGPEPFGAVLIDEAQDLDPSSLRMLANLCSGPNRLFLAADANQAIYGGGFTWSDVHENLRFTGRTGILRTNFRTTREIGEAARSYLLADPAVGALDTADASVPDDYAHEGPTPAMRRVSHMEEEIDLLTRFLPQALRFFQFGRSACAILVPSDNIGRQIATGLTERGMAAHFMTGRELDLTARAIKVLTLKSAKGLEFPVVALAGFVQSSYPRRPVGLPDDAWEEQLARERRTLYVGMTRAMRALLVISGSGDAAPLFTGFDPAYWNVG